MKVYIISKGQYYAGEREWVRNKNHAFDFVDNYGRSYAITHALRTAEFLKTDRLHSDARPVRYLE